jgi:hypothetical protein
MLEGRKVWTSRTSQYGHPGDRFKVFNTWFVIEDVVLMKLGDVVKHWKEEGVESEDEFVRVWKEIHPMRGFDNEQVVFVHKFRKEV